MQKAKPEVERLAAQLRQEQEVFCSCLHMLQATYNASELQKQKLPSCRSAAMTLLVP